MTAPSIDARLRQKFCACLKPDIVRYVREESRCLASRLRCPSLGREDIEQEIFLDLWIRWRCFDAGRSRKRTFNICFEIGVKELIRDGFLCSLVTKSGREKADTGLLHVRAGEFKGAMKEAEFDVEFGSDSSDAHLQAIITAFISDTPLAFKIADKESGAGMDADFEIMEMDDDQKLDDGIGIKFTIKPTYISRYPTWSNGSQT